ncbi:MAG: transglycosylase SLT domain-containing protein [Bdellovibrionales bacterium]|jgi:membrane-bound lytic murein transglycosylase D|nr:transglycosylase SLT domain-containing protein [Bdellovibrionales bacterium]
MTDLKKSSRTLAKAPVSLAASFFSTLGLVALALSLLASCASAPPPSEQTPVSSKRRVSQKARAEKAQPGARVAAQGETRRRVRRPRLARPPISDVWAHAPLSDIETRGWVLLNSLKESSDSPSADEKSPSLTLTSNVPTTAPEATSDGVTDTAPSAAAATETDAKATAPPPASGIAGGTPASNRANASLGSPTAPASANGKFRRLEPEKIDLGLAAADKVVTNAAHAQNGAGKSYNEAHLIFDFPVTYNARVRKWIKYFQTSGRTSFRRWLERSSRFIPGIQEELKKANLPLDLAYVAMIESGFSSSAVSHAHAMGMWQFIAPTGRRYGLHIDWWIDERRDFEKATRAAIGYMTDLFGQFGSWYLVAASYNMGENGVRRLIRRHKTNSYWELADRGALPEETRNYVPKMLAAMLIAKAPALYGFREIEAQVPYSFEYFNAPGGTDLINLANHLGVSERSLTELNPELLKGFIPREVRSHKIRIPKGAHAAVAQYLNN